MNKVCPYDFRPARFMHNDVGYFVKLYLLFDGSVTHTFYNSSDQIENAHFARQSGNFVYSFNYDVLVTSDTFPEIFKVIQDYVSESHLNR